MDIVRSIYKAVRRFLFGYVLPIFNRAHARVCPCCTWSGQKFLSFGKPKRLEAQCPRCGALERQRLYILFLQKKLEGVQNLSVLHFAPEEPLKKFFLALPGVRYISADIRPGRAMTVEDITKISHADNSFDFIMCAHVLEHIPDDQKAMKELLRVLKPKGTALLQVPLSGKLTTHDDETITSPQERQKYFGQHDHVRYYGEDYPDRLRAAGFVVEASDFMSTYSKEDVIKYGLAHETIFFCTKQ